MQNINTEALFAAINAQQKEFMYAARATAPAGGHCNSFGLVLYGGAISWQGFGGVTVIYGETRMKWLRRTAYAYMPMAQYMTDEDVLYHYFLHLTPSALLFDATLQVSQLPADVLCAVKLN